MRIDGVRIDDLPRRALLATVERFVDEGGRHTIAYANANVLNRASEDERLRTFLNDADLCYCDGNGVRFAAKTLGHRVPERITGADWIEDFARRAEGRWRLYWMGGAPGVAAEAAARLQAVHPRLAIASDHGFHADSEPLEKMNAFAPDVVFVGMGTPRQEHWIAEWRSKIEAPVVWCVGGLQDYVAGRVGRPGPRWLIERHEWLSRLATDPRRLWRRYLLGNARFVARTLSHKMTGE